jgi:hypothetical protein
MKINKNETSEIKDADFEELQPEAYVGDTVDESAPSVLFRVILKDIVENKDGEEIKYKIASFDSVDDHPFNYEFVGSILQLVLSSYVSFAPEEDRSNFANMSVKAFLNLLGIGEGEKQEGQEDEDFTPDQPEHDGN